MLAWWRALPRAVVEARWNEAVQPETSASATRIKWMVEVVMFSAAQMSCKCCRQRKVAICADDASAMLFKENVKIRATQLSSPGILTFRGEWGNGIQ
jgi:hypothetical protein